MPVRNIIGRGIGFSPGKAGWTLTHGFGLGEMLSGGPKEIAWLDDNRVVARRDDNYEIEWRDDNYKVVIRD